MYPVSVLLTRLKVLDRRLSTNVRLFFAVVPCLAVFWAGACFVTVQPPASDGV
jgi:hypothetical protein